MTDSVDPDGRDYSRLVVNLPKNALPRIHVISRPGTGKGELLGHLVLEDILRQHGITVIDRHGHILNGSDLEAVLRTTPGMRAGADLDPWRLLAGMPAEPTMTDPCGATSIQATGTWGDAAHASTTVIGEAAVDTATPVGFRIAKGVRRLVSIPLDLRLRGTHIIGSSGTGKSTLVERMVLHDIQQGHGVAVLDPCGGLAEGLLRLIPRGHANRVVYLNPGDPLWAPAWNPLRQRIPAYPGLITDAVTSALLPRCRFSDRPEHITRQAVLAASRLPDGNLWDAWDLLRCAKRSDRHAARLRSRILRASGDDQMAKRFWRDDVTRYSWGELQSAVVVLRRLLASGPCSRMFSQRESPIDLCDIMESGKILLLDLSRISSEAGDVLGALVLALLHLAAVSRQGPDDRTVRPFHIYCDEAHRFTPNGPDALMADTRRFGVSMTFTCQFMRQSDSCHADVLLNVGSTIMFRVYSDDAHELCKGLQGKVTVDDLVALDSGLAVARIGGRVVRLRTLPRLEIPNDNCRDLIVQRCHEQYYRPVR